MGHLIGGNFSIPVGRQGIIPTRVNANINEKTFINFGTGFCNGAYNMPNLYGNLSNGGCCGNHNQSWNFGDYVLGTMSASAGFLQGFLGGKVKAEEPAPQGNNKAFEEAIKKNQEMIEARQKEYQQLVEQITKLKNSSQAEPAQET